ncbi:MAG: peptidase [Ignavibacteriae bacterium]|nr:peptidase [Ignavibacteriota bacterium]
MKKGLSLIIFMLLLTTFSCTKQDDAKKEGEIMNTSELPSIAERVKAYAPTDIKVDISNMTENQKKLVQLLVEAGKIADEIFWQQTSFDAISIRDSLLKLNNPDVKDLLEYVKINYGPYDLIHEHQRFVGEGPQKRFDGGTYYPQDMTKEEFEKYIAAHPEQKAELESQYTVIVRDGAKLKAVPFHEAYPLTIKLADKLEEAAKFADNPTFKNYLMLRAKAIRTDDYFESDMAWMDIKNSDIDIVIGPIENYEDAIFNYKTAYECVVMIKDLQATKDLEMFNHHVLDFEKNLPYDKKYIRDKVGQGTQINFVNVAYFGGDCQKGIKTIAASLPNDPKVREAKGGGKNSMYKNMMEAKFDKIVIPIGHKILENSLVPFLDKKAFITFVTLHEVSHTLGRDIVFGTKDMSVRKSMKEKYSAIEEAKADILGLYNHKILVDMKIYDNDYLKKTMVTYLAGLYRSIRFGAEEAHGKANLVQLNFIRFR